MAKWIYNFLGVKELYVFDVITEINVPLGVGRSDEWVIIPKDAKYEGL